MEAAVARRGRGTGRRPEVARGRLEKRLDRLPAWQRSDPASEHLAKHPARHRDQVFTFLDHPGLDATCWRAGQAIRPPGVNRKVWGGRPFGSPL